MMMSNKGGRGRINPYPSEVIRVPGPLAARVWELIDRFRAKDYEGSDLITDEELRSLILEIVSKNKAKEKGYCTNSFGTGIKQLRSIAEKIK